METAIKGVFEHRRLLDLIRSFVVFEDDGKTVAKKVAQYHQFHAVRKALATALRASGAVGGGGDGRGGVLWHTQRSGKSLTMLFFAGKLVTHPIMTNPTIVMLTDRNDLDDQLFGTFSGGQALLRQTPVQAENRAHLRDLLAEVAADLVEHIGRREEVIAGKVMIVAMSRRICVDLYDALVKLKPEWAESDDASGVLKVVMTGSASDDLNWQPHIRNKEGREGLADRFKDAEDSFRIVIVRDMWLTGFDVPSLHTMYIDKPMRGHGLMQAIARVNRVFRDKPGGLVVDYLGLANNLKAALRSYMREGAEGKPVENVDFKIADLIDAMLRELEICRDLFRGFSYDAFLTGAPSERVAVISDAQDFLYLRDRRERDAKIAERFLMHASALLKAFALASATNEAQKIKTEVAFFQTVRAAISKTTGKGSGKSDEQMDHAIRQLVDAAITPEGVVDIFAAAGLEKPDISILSDEFLAEIREMPQRNLALELLRKLLNDEIGATRKTGVVLARRFSERLEESLNRYHNRALETAQIIEAMIELARDLRAANARGEQLDLATDELAFYDALGDGQLREIAREVAETVRGNVSIDWTQREQAKANLRRLVRRVLRKHGYPPDLQEGATQLVIEQAEEFARAETATGPQYRG